MVKVEGRPHAEFVARWRRVQALLADNPDGSGLTAPCPGPDGCGEPGDSFHTSHLTAGSADRLAGAPGRLDFSGALIALKEGHHLRRASWPDGRHTYLKRGFNPGIYRTEQRLKPMAWRWTPTVEDLLACDWVITTPPASADTEPDADEAGVLAVAARLHAIMSPAGLNPDDDWTHMNQTRRVAFYAEARNLIALATAARQPR